MDIIVPDAFEVTIYLDLPDEAAADVRCLGWEDERGPFRNEQEAAGFAKRGAALRGWSTWSATIDRGHVTEQRIEGAPLREFVDEERDRWYVGPDWFDYESRA